MRLLSIKNILGTLLCGALLISCNGKTNSNSADIKIGVVGPFEGPNSHIGKLIMNSVKLYFERNRNDTFNVSLVPIDTKSNPADTVAALQATVSDQQLVALIAFYHSSTALAGKPIITEAKLPTLIYSASNPAVTDSAPFYFRLVPTDDNQAIVLADYAKDLGTRSAAIFYYADEYGKGLSDGIQQRAKENGLNIVSVQSYDATTTDFRPMLTLVKAKNPDAVFICGFVDKSIAILNQAAEKGLRTKFIAGDGTFNEEQLMQGAGSNAEGVYVAAPYVFDETNQKNKDFLEAYWSTYSNGNRQKPASWCAFAYDAAAIIDKAFR
jgi:ABC-type branched-chain amino acid transport systems, periplasmic component